MTAKPVVVAAAAIAGTVATAASAIELTIHPGVGIGKVKLGMTQAQVQRVLGRDSFVNAREGTYTELAWDFASWTVGFKGRRAVQVSTSGTADEERDWSRNDVAAADACVPGWALRVERPARCQREHKGATGPST